MSLTLPDHYTQGLYIRAHTGDIDQDPELTEAWLSYFLDDDDRKNNDFSGMLDIPNKEHTNVLKGIREYIPSRSRFASFAGENAVVETECTTQDKLHQYEDGSYVLNCLKGRQNFKKGINEHNSQVMEDLKHNFRKNEDGTIEIINKDSLKRQKQVFGILMKQFGAALLSGKSLTSISLPVLIFKGMSALEQEARCYANAPHFLERAGTISDTLEQFKLTICHQISSLHLFIGIGKPFNPLHGETFQAVVGGCPLYVEQISHHPPISALEMMGKNFKTESTTETTVSMSLGFFKLCRVGHQKVKFRNTNTMIKAQLPPWCAIGGIGKKTVLQFANKLYMFDIANKLYAEITFDYEEPTLFKKGKHSQDHFSGSIWRVNDKFIEQLKQLPKKKHELDEIKFKEKEHAVEHITIIEGLWLEYLKIGEKIYWSVAEQEPYKLQYFDHPLPSDSNFRPDVLHLREGDEIKAQVFKEQFEEEQRKDKKMREKYRKSHK